MAAIGTGSNFPPEDPTFIQKALSLSLACGIITPVIGVFMHLLNRTRIVGKENLTALKPPYIVALNHLTLLDDLFLGPVIFFPGFLKGYSYLPYHAPEERNFYKLPLIAQFMRNSKAIPLIRGRGILQDGVNRMIRAIRNGGILQIYPEGTRTRTGELGDGKEGVGRIVQESGAPVIPIYHQGLEAVLPIGYGVPRIGKEIRIAIGTPIQFREEWIQDSNPSIWREISARIMEGIKEQRMAAERRWGAKPVIVKIATRRRDALTD